MKGEYRARAGAGAQDTVFQVLHGKTTYDPSITTIGTTAWETNYPFCSQQIPCDPTDISFVFGSSSIVVSIYAPYPTTPDSTDPTSDSNQFVTSYVADFSGWGRKSGDAHRSSMECSPGESQCRFPNPGHVLQYTSSGSVYNSETYPLAE